MINWNDHMHQSATRSYRQRRFSGAFPKRMWETIEQTNHLRCARVSRGAAAFNEASSFVHSNEPFICLVPTKERGADTNVPECPSGQSVWNVAKCGVR